MKESDNDNRFILKNMFARLKNFMVTSLAMGSTVIIGQQPIALQETMVQISFLVINSVINDMGLMQSAGYGAAQKISAGKIYP